MDYLIAVDGGGTKTDFALVQSDGTVRRRVTLGPSNYQNTGTKESFDVLKQGVSTLTQGAGHGRLLGACLGLAGLDTPHDERVYREMIAEIFPDAQDRIVLENDCFVALQSGTLGAPGIALIAGTGSMAVGLNEKGERARSGGWGYRFGDEGSGYYIGYQAIVRALRGRDGRGPITRLAEMIEVRLDGDLFDLVIRYTAQDPGPDLLASLAPLVSEAADAGDLVAQQILQDAADELVLAASAITKQLSFVHRPIPVVLAGGAFHSAILRSRVEAGLRAVIGNVKPLRPTLPPVAGACIMALHQAQIPLTDNVVANLTTSLKSDE